ncbi:MAG: hypothetical protein WCD76_04545, partial [Pyrinomonadaceae bacterium]
VAYWGMLALLHARALARAGSVAQSLAAQRGERVVRVAAMPVLADPTRWLCVAETERATIRFDLSLNAANDARLSQFARRIETPQGDAGEIVALASQDRRAVVFLNFARFPVTSLRRDCIGETLVQFADLRFTEPGQGGSFALEIPVENR